MNPSNPYQEQDPNTGYQKPLTAEVVQPRLDISQLAQMQNAAGSAVTWFRHLQTYVENNPGVAIAVGLGILVLGLNSQGQQQEKGKRER